MRPLPPVGGVEITIRRHIRLSRCSWPAAPATTFCRRPISASRPVYARCSKRTRNGHVTRAYWWLLRDRDTRPSSNFSAVVKLLLDYNADPHDADYGGLPVLYFALEYPPV